LREARGNQRGRGEKKGEILVSLKYREEKKEGPSLMESVRVGGGGSWEKGRKRGRRCPPPISYEKKEGGLIQIFTERLKVSLSSERFASQRLQEKKRKGGKPVVALDLEKGGTVRLRPGRTEGAKTISLKRGGERKKRKKIGFFVGVRETEVKKQPQKKSGHTRGAFVFMKKEGCFSRRGKAGRKGGERSNCEIW